MSGKTYYAPIQDLPCVTELYKTDERQLYHKCLDVGQVLFSLPIFPFSSILWVTRESGVRRP